VAFWDRERITLVIEDDALRLMGVQRGVVTRWGSAPLPKATLAADGALAEPVALAQVLERLWASHGQERPVPRDTVVMAIPGTRVPSRMVALAGPATGDPEALAALAREALPDIRAYHAWQVVGTATQPGLFVVAPPASLLEGYLHALEQAGLGAIAIDLKPLALIRGVGQRHTVIVDGERMRGSVIVVDDALPRRVRFVTLDAPLRTSPEEKVIRLVEALHETIRLYNSESPGEAIHPAVPIYLTGSLAEHPNLRDAVREVLGHPIGHIVPPIQLPPDLPVSQFLANVGLAQKRL
jgi:hypothetical protein